MLAFSFKMARFKRPIEFLFDIWIISLKITFSNSFFRIIFLNYDHIELNPYNRVTESLCVCLCVCVLTTVQIWFCLTVQLLMVGHRKVYNYFKGGYQHPQEKSPKKKIHSLNLSYSLFLKYKLKVRDGRLLLLRAYQVVILIAIILKFVKHRNKSVCVMY